MLKATSIIVAGVAAMLLAAASSSAGSAAPRDVTCSQVTQSFSGTARDLTVPPNGYCDIENATITHDLIVKYDAGGDVTNSTIAHDARYADEAGGDVTSSTIGHDLIYSRDSGGAIYESTIGHDLTAGFHSGLNLAASRIGHDLVAYRPGTVQTGGISPTEVGQVLIGNDFVIDGSPGPPDPSAFVFDGMCDLSVGHDLSITNRWVTLGIGLGDGCGGSVTETISVGHDVVFSGNSALTGFFGPSGLDVVGLNVGHDLTVTRNTAAARVEVGDNTVGANATCRNNNPAATEDGAGPNSIAGRNNGCP
jgi:hypothetical protein